jgi:adenosylhomocysteine nucleosidase
VGGLPCLIGQRADRTFWLFQTGVGPDAAAAAARAVLMEQPISLVISTGFASALDSAGIGDLIVGTEISSVRYDGAWTREGGAMPCDRGAHKQVVSVANRVGIVAHVGSVVSVSTVVCRAEEKRDIRRATGAMGLDMESAALGRIAHERQVPFVVIRTVSDLVDEELPLDFNLFLRPTSWWRGIRELIRRPSRLAGLNRLRKQSRLAADQLTKLFDAYAAEELACSPSK